MCYLKHVKSEENLDLNNLHLKEEDTPDTVLQEGNQEFLQVQSPKVYIKTEEQEKLCRLISLLARNNELISNLNKSLHENSQQLTKITIKIENDPSIERKQSNLDLESTNFRPKFVHGQETICSRLFGLKRYKYFLEATQKFDQTIYKERNFNIGVRLINQSGKKVRNNNLLTLCFAVCTSDADWIHENRVGDPFMKGKTEIQLFKGEAQFEKLHPREVSRIYPNGKVHIVIYPKSCNVRYSSPETSGEYIDYNLIKPLIIEDICIRAKKTE